jgi:hypothetical protein
VFTQKEFIIFCPSSTVVYLIEVLKIMAQMLQYITFLSLKATQVSSDFILNYLKKVEGGATTQKYQKQMLKH